MSYRELQEGGYAKKEELTRSAQILIALIGFLVTAFPLGGLVIFKLYQFVSRNDVMKEILTSSNKLQFSVIIGGIVGFFLGLFGAIILLCIITAIRNWKYRGKL